MTTLKLFLWDVETDEEISGDTPLEASPKLAIEKLQALSKEDGSFIGFELDNGSIVQFMWDDEEILNLDIPSPNGGYEKVVSLSEAENIVERLFTGLNPKAIEGIKFEEY